jgi:hypothetical protein
MWQVDFVTVKRQSEVFRILKNKWDAVPATTPPQTLSPTM